MSGAESPPSPASIRRPTLWGNALVLGVFVLIVAVGLAWWARRAPVPGGSRHVPARAVNAKDVSAMYVGARVCARCHPVEAAAAGSSGHSRTLVRGAETPLARLLDGTTVTDPEDPGVKWKYQFRQGRFSVARIGTGPQDSGEVAVDWALGSGKHATTFVSLSEGAPGQRHGLEHRLTYYTGSKSLGLTPGQQDFPDARQVPFGWVLPPDVLYGCLNCHSTLTSASGRAVLDVATLIPNVTCERCHGPGRQHVAKAARGAPAAALAMPLGRGRATAEAEIRSCGECHRLPQVLPPSAVRPDNPFLSRFQSIGLMESTCYRASRGTLRCTTCHDPHERVSTELVSYSEACLSCHEKAPQRTCTVPSHSECVTCHMPKRDVGFQLTFTDHWIRAHPSEPR